MLSLKKSLIKYLSHFIDLIYPDICGDCEEKLMNQEEEYCTFCRWNFPWNRTEKELERRGKINNSL